MSCPRKHWWSFMRPKTTEQIIEEALETMKLPVATKTALTPKEFLEYLHLKLTKEDDLTVYDRHEFACATWRADVLVLLKDQARGHGFKFSPPDALDGWAFRITKPTTEGCAVCGGGHD